jgi:hypothetical protein
MVGDLIRSRDVLSDVIETASDPGLRPRTD